MQITRHTKKVEKTAHYATYGELSESTKYFWFALHGSHMLCEQMLFKFEGFNPKEHFVVSPEGLSRFYLKGFGGDVVATWMTSHDRLIEIEDFTAFLSALYYEYEMKLPADCKKILFGFSQGGTSAFRWMYNRKIDFDHILAYSTWFPEDLDFSKSKSDFNENQIIYTIGDEDQYMNDERMEFLKNVADRNNFKVRYEIYKGTHRIEKNQLKHLFHKYFKM